MTGSGLPPPLLYEIISWGETELTHHQIDNPCRVILRMAGD